MYKNSKNFSQNFLSGHSLLDNFFIILTQSACTSGHISTCRATTMASHSAMTSTCSNSFSLDPDGPLNRPYGRN